MHNLEYDGFVFNARYAKALLSTLLNKVENNKFYKISFKEIQNLKTKEQLGFIFGGIFKAIRLYFENLGYSFTNNQVKEWIYEEIGVIEEIILPSGQLKHIRKTLSAMTKKEANSFIFKLLQFIDSSEALQDFVLPPDLRYCWTRHIDLKVIEEAQQAVFNDKNEYYLKHQRSLTCIRCGRRGGQVHHIQHGSGYAKKNPDWFSVPVCPDCHINYLHSQVGEEIFLDDIKFLMSELDIETFCRINYTLWQEHKIY